MIKYSKTRGWTFNGRSIYNPLRIIWNILILVPFTSAIILFGLMLLLVTFDLDEVNDFVKKYWPGL